VRIFQAAVTPTLASSAGGASSTVVSVVDAGQMAERTYKLERGARPADLYRYTGVEAAKTWSARLTPATCDEIHKVCIVHALHTVYSQSESESSVGAAVLVRTTS
jgi:hypothetical protein